MGRQLNASVLYIINEVEFSIYRFLTSGAKKNKKKSQPVELGINQFTSCWSIKCLAGDRYPQSDFDRTSTEKERLLEEREIFSSLD